MNVSQVFINNYKSLKNINLRLEKGKNVIVGKNNSGKSNIISALNLLFGDKFPSYINFDDNDFYTCNVVNNETGEIKEITSNYFYIHAKLEGKDFDIGELKKIKKSIAFSLLSNPKALIDTTNGCVDYEFLTNLDEIETSNKISTITLKKNNGEPYTAKTKWLKSEALIEFLKSAEYIVVFFCKARCSDNSGFGLFVVNSLDCWVSHFFSNKLRDSLITTAIIPAFRNPKDELRLVHYTWYGKLIKAIWDSGKSEVESEITTKTDEIKLLADKVFEKATLELKELLQKAISHKNVTFKLLSNQKDNVYKNVSIYVDDGIDRPIDTKGSGIQSAIIISLFTSFCNSFHKSSSMLITEEPELFLHPQARRVISSELEKYLGNTLKRQLVVSTHSSDFVKNVPIQNIIIARKNITTNETITSQINYNEKLTKDEANKIIRFIWSKNTDIFFSDKVLLVEGGEEFLLPAIFDKLSNENHVLDYNNISIARVDGKGNFLTYIKILDKFNIPWAILGDLDCYDDILRELMVYTSIDTSDLDLLKDACSKKVNYKKVTDEVIKNPSSFDGLKLAELFRKVKEKKLSIENDELIEFIEYLEERFTKNNFKEIIKTETTFVNLFNKIQIDLQKNNIYILSNGAIEDYYTEKAWSVEAKGKENRALELANLLNETQVDMKEYINSIDEFKQLLKELMIKEDDFQVTNS